MLRDSLLKRIFEKVSADLFSYARKKYLVYSDRYSGWPSVFQFKTGDTKSFANFGVPVRLRTDRGPHFKSKKFSYFVQNCGVVHQRSIPYYPKGSSHAESAVKAMKYLLMKTPENGDINTDEFQQGLLE